LAAVAVLLAPSIVAAEKVTVTTGRQAAKARVVVQPPAREARPAQRLWIATATASAVPASVRPLLITTRVWPPAPLQAKNTGTTLWFPNWQGLGATLVPLLIPAGFSAAQAARGGLSAKEQEETPAVGEEPPTAADESARELQ